MVHLWRGGVALARRVYGPIARNIKRTEKETSFSLLKGVHLITIIIIVLWHVYVGFFFKNQIVFFHCDVFLSRCDRIRRLKERNTEQQKDLGRISTQRQTSGTCKTRVLYHTTGRQQSVLDLFFSNVALIIV